MRRNEGKSGSLFCEMLFGREAATVLHTVHVKADCFKDLQVESEDMLLKNTQPFFFSNYTHSDTSPPIFMQCSRLVWHIHGLQG